MSIKRYDLRPCDEYPLCCPLKPDFEGDWVVWEDIEKEYLELIDLLCGLVELVETDSRMLYRAEDRFKKARDYISKWRTLNYRGED